MAFFEAQFPVNVSYGAHGGSGWSTRLLSNEGAFETRAAMWARARGRWTVGHALRKPAEWHTLLSFHRLALGRTHGFRFQDWSDYTQETAPGSGVQAGFLFPNDQGHLQLMKVYTQADINTQLYTYYRRIYKPQPGTITITDNCGYVRTGWALDYTTGVVSGGDAKFADLWHGKFDTPVRFDTDTAQVSIDFPDGASWSGVPLVELFQTDS